MAALKAAIELKALEFVNLKGFVSIADLSFDLFFFAPFCALAHDAVARLGSRLLRYPALVLIGVLVWVVILSDLLTLEYFRENVLVILPRLAKENSVSDLGAGGPLRYVASWVVVTSIAGVATIMVLFRGRINGRDWVALPSIIAIVGCIWVQRHDSVVEATMNAITDNTIYYTGDDAITDASPQKKLRPASHAKPVPADAAMPAPQTIVLIIDESTPWWFPSSADPKVPVFSSLLAQTGTPASDWVVFTHGFTNSPATAISMPSILTGSDPMAGTDSVESLPFVYDCAKVQGYRTAFFTSQLYDFFDLRRFFTSEALDVFVSGEMTGQPIRNMGGIDDMYIADKVCDYLRSASKDQKLFMVINNNALHVAYQVESRIDVPRLDGDARRKASYILEHAYQEIFACLKETGRLDKSLVILTSDHGELDPQRPREDGRLDANFDEVITIPMAIHLPVDAPSGLKATLLANRDRTVENLDIAPTLEAAVGASPPQPLRLPGWSWFQSLPSDRISVSVTQNEWKEWEPRGFGLACLDDRLVYSDKVGMAYYDIATDPMQIKPVRSGKVFDRYYSVVAEMPELARNISNGAPKH